MAKNEKILVLGGSGQIGSVAVKQLSKRFKIIAPIHSQLDVTDRNAVLKFLKRSKPDQILYIAGYTNTDGAREEAGKAFLINAGAVLHISHFASNLNIPFHYLSTELVFNGEKSFAPYTEKDTPDPLLVNGKTKQLGELATLNASKNNSVIRLIMCYSPIFEKKGDLARLVVKKLSSNESLSATDDQLVNPIYVFHLIEAIAKILEKRASGIFHVGATTYTTPYKFAMLVAKTLKLNYLLIKPVKFKDFSKTRPEPRPKDQWLNTKKFVKTFGKGILKPLEEGIEDFARDYKRLNK